MESIFAFNIPKITLVKALAHVQGVVERQTILTALSNIKITATDGLVELTATDMAITVSQKLAMPVKQTGELTVSAHILFDIIRKLDENLEVCLSVTSQQPGLLNITSGKSRFSLPTLPPEQFPTIDSENFSHVFHIEAKALCEMLDKTKFAICTEESRYNLNGLHLHYDQTMTAVATDGHRLCLESIECKESFENFPQVIIPKKTTLELRKIAEDTKELVKISVSVRKIQFEAGNIKLVSKLVDARFPDYTSLIPLDNNLKIKVNAKMLTKIIDRVAIVTDDKSRGIKLIATNTSISFVASSEIGGRSEESVDISYSNLTDTLEIGFNARYLLEGISAVHGDEITLSLKDSFSSMMIEDSADSAFKYIIMPMRV